MAVATAKFEQGLNGPGRDAFAALTQLFNSYGLTSLAKPIADYIRNGYSADTISILLQDRPEYKKRFVGNDARRAKGLPVLSPAEYLATESSYRQVMRAAGLPAGFYDKPEDFTSFMGNDVSPTEIQGRITAASQFIDNATPDQKALFGQWYSKGDMVAYALDPTRAAPLVGKAFTAASIGGEAKSNKIDITQGQATDLAARGVTADQASQGFGIIAQNLPNDQKLAALGGTQISAYDQMREVFYNDASVTAKRDRLSSQERGRFGGSSGTGSGSLGKSNAGQI